MSVVAVFGAIDEVTARAILAVLKDQGIAAELRQFHNPWEISWIEGNPWGEILVLAEDAESARQIIEDFLGEVSKDEESEDESSSDEISEDGTSESL